MIRQPIQKRKPAKERTPTSSIDERFSALLLQFELLKAQVHQAQQLATLGTAAATFAHEVNNLLTPILSYAESAIQANEVEFSKKALTVVVRNVRMLIAMSGRMLEIGAAKPHQREKTDVREAATEALASMCRDLEKDGIALSMNIEKGVIVLADPLQLRQILFNLFLNAQEAMATIHSGRLVVSARNGPKAVPVAKAVQDETEVATPPNMVVIEVRNTGPAIPAELLPTIFEPFKTSKPVQRNGKYRCGGLGLALVRNLVHDNEGTIEVKSDSESGTTFIITLKAPE